MWVILYAVLIYVLITGPSCVYEEDHVISKQTECQPHYSEYGCASWILERTYRDIACYEFGNAPDCVHKILSQHGFENDEARRIADNYTFYKSFLITPPPPKVEPPKIIDDPNTEIWEELADGV
jgi:hypothetical protein